MRENRRSWCGETPKGWEVLKLVYGVGTEKKAQHCVGGGLAQDATTTRDGPLLPQDCVGQNCAKTFTTTLCCVRGAVGKMLRTGGNADKGKGKMQRNARAQHLSLS